MATKLSQKLIGLFSTLILARLLVPEDFGLVAIIWLVIMFLQALTEAGTEDYIVQKKTVTDDDLNTSWTLNFLLRLFVVLCLILAAPFIAEYYDNSNLTSAILVLAVALAIQSLLSPVIIQLKRERNYKPIFKIELFTKVMGAVITVIAAFIFRSYWALIIGHCVSMSTRCVLSYVWFDYRPKFTLIKVKEQFNFSQWVLLRSIFGYCRAQLDTFLVSSRFGIASLGGYHISKYIAAMPATEGLTPIMSPLMASFSEVQTEPKKLKYQIKFSLIIVFALMIPIGAFFFANAADISAILLGSKWVEYTAVFSVLSLTILSRPLYNFATSILYVIKKPKHVLYYDVISFIGLALALVFVEVPSLVAFAWLKVLVDGLFIGGYFIYALNKANVEGLVKNGFLLIVLAIVTFTFSFSLANWMQSDLNPILRLMMIGPLFCVFWLICCLGVFKWCLKGKEIGHHLVHIEKGYLKNFAIFGKI